MEEHNYAFFGKEQALIIITRNLQDKVHLNFIKKVNEKWQQLNQGIHIELNVEELCNLVHYLNTQKADKGINFIHQFSEGDDIKNYKVQYVFNKDSKKLILFVKAKLDNKPEYLKFSKPFKNGKLRFLIKIFEHLESEKVANYKSKLRNL